MDRNFYTNIAYRHPTGTQSEASNTVDDHLRGDAIFLGDAKIKRLTTGVTSRKSPRKEDVKTDSSGRIIAGSTKKQLDRKLPCVYRASLPCCSPHDVLDYTEFEDIQLGQRGMTNLAYGAKETGCDEARVTGRAQITRKN